MFAPDELIAALSDCGVDYVLIGGLAVGAHGFPRATKDVDIVPAPNEGNLDRLAKVLGEIEAHNFGAGDFDPAEFPFDHRGQRIGASPRPSGPSTPARLPPGWRIRDSLTGVRPG